MKLEQVTDNEFSESYGMYLEDFFVGMKVNHFPGRTITESDNTWMTLLSMNHHPLHFNKHYAAETEFGAVLVNSVITFAIINGMTVQSMSARTVANLGWEKVRMTAPVFVGDTLYASSEVLHIRESKSRPNQGIVTIKTIGTNEKQEQVMTCERSFLIPTRAYVGA